MANTEILVRLRELHEELASINSDMKIDDRVDDDTIDALGQLVTDVSVLVDRSKDALAHEQTELPERHDVLDRIMQFEAAHPRVTQFLSQMTDVLAMMGI